MHKLQHKLALCVLGSLILMSALVSYLVVSSARRRLDEDLEYTGRTLAATVAAFCVETILEGDWPYLETYIGKAARSSPIVEYIRVWSDFDLEDAGANRRLVAQYPAVSLHVEAAGRRVFHNPVLMEVEGFAPELLGKVELALSTARHDELVAATTRQFLGGGCAAFLVLSFIFAMLLRRQVVEPIEKLDEHATRIGRGELDSPIRLQSRDELGRLAKTMELMRLGLKSSYSRIEKQIEELQELDRLKDEFLANTSHELKTPLNGIIGLTEGLLVGDYGDLPDDLRKPVETVGSCAERLRQMTESILRYSQLVHKKEKTGIPVAVHRLDDHLNECLLDIVTAADRKGIRFLITVPPGLDASYPREELEQVVRILADNAVKFTDRGLVEIIACRWDPRGPAGFQIAVRDTGKGIPEHLKLKVFEPFVQGFHHETRSQSGVGLGLAIASKLSKELGWHIVIESAEGEGTSFTVLVPEQPVEEVERCFVPWPPFVAPQRDADRRRRERRKKAAAGAERLPDHDEEEPDAPAAAPVPASRQRHVLITDDDPVNREVVWLALHNEFRVTQAATGEECLDLLEREPVDLLVLDIMMPRVSGYDVLRGMRERGLLGKIPVIILSAKSSPRHTVKGLQLGAADYLAKPFHREELLSRIRTQMKLREQRERLLEEVQAKEQALQLAREASQAKTQFLANMSHEILTPLNGIQGFLDLLGAERSKPESQEDYLRGARECTKSLLAVARDILDMAKIESRSTEVEWHECDAVEMLSAIAEGFRGDASEKDLSLDLELAVGDRCPITTDPGRLRRIVANLVGNALKFTSEGGVRIVARRGGGGPPASDRLLIDVIDSGPGIAPEDHEAIFHAFHQIDGSDRRSHGGLGLGLSLSRVWARMLGGDILVESAPGSGSRFTLAIPCCAARSEPAAPDRAERRELAT